MTAAVVVFAVGNPSRGDDAIGPELAARLEAEQPAGVAVVTDFQLQVEHAIDLEGRELALFVDAAVDAEAPYELRVVRPQRDRSHTTHALSPAAVLETFERCTGRAAPPAWVLAVRGEHFELGAPLSDQARDNLEAAWRVLRAFSFGEIPES
ncbi:MAG: hydrogenase maturation protease [Gammaproteobacteria bacterium]|jgi:hydrogenase maturation protease